MSSLSSIPLQSEIIISDNSLGILDLSLLNDISGELLIGNNTISSDVRLFSLSCLGGNLIISNNYLLQNLYFYFLSSLSGNLMINNNDQLENLQMSSLNTFGGYILVSQNPLVKTLVIPFTVAENDPYIVIRNWNPSVFPNWAALF